jgi:hypothetical protein
MLVEFFFGECLLVYDYGVIFVENEVERSTGTYMEKLFTYQNNSD